MISLKRYKYFINNKSRRTLKISLHFLMVMVRYYHNPPKSNPKNTFTLSDFSICGRKRKEYKQSKKK